MAWNAGDYTWQLKRKRKMQIRSSRKYSEFRNTLLVSIISRFYGVADWQGAIVTLFRIGGLWTRCAGQWRSGFGMQEAG